MKTRAYAIEIFICLLAVAILELTYYISTSDDFSVYIYMKSVLEIFAAPVYPGWHLIYPTVIQFGIFGIILSLSKLRNGLLRITGIFLSTAGWAVLGFFTIIKYYN